MLLRSRIFIVSLALFVPQLHAADQVELFPAKSGDWKQAGPGKFAVTDGVATAEGGMGLWWYSGKSFKNATINLEFSLPDTKWNSGVFVRFPDPKNDPWIAVKQGYECQISGDKAEKLSTGAIYDIQAASHIPLKKPGEWNQYQITTVGNKIAIRLNGELVNIFTTQPGRGDQQGYFGLQNHDPKSKVSFRKVTVQEWDDDANLDDVLRQVGVTRAEWLNYRNMPKKKATWYEKMDTGPAWANSFGDYYQGVPRVGALKGLRLELSKTDSIHGLFDTETLRFASAYQGGVHWAGTPWTGRHGSLVSMANETSSIFQTSTKPGWADQNGSFEDTRKFPGHGNLAPDHARFNGHYRQGNQTILDYSVRGSRVLEMPSGEVAGTTPLAFRQFDLAPCDHDRIMLVADNAGAKATVSEDKQSATIVSTGADQSDGTPRPQVGKVSVVMDRSDDGWEMLSMGKPSSKDLIDRKTNKQAYFRVLSDFNQAHAKSGSEEDVAVRLNDGLTSRNSDDVGRSFFFADKKQAGRLELGLGSLKDISRIHLFSEHKSNRSPQKVAIYGSSNDNADPKLATDKLEAGGWQKVATYDTRELGNGGKHGVAILAPEGKPIGSFHKLLFICQPGQKNSFSHTFFSEIDVYGEQAPALKPLARVHQNNSSYCVAVRGTGVQLKDAGNGTLTLHIPANKKATRFALGYASSGQSTLAATLKTLQSATPAPRELESLTHGGPALYAQPVSAKASLGSEDDIWSVDRIGLPSDNPWHSNMRVGGFDFFSDGDSAAVCTWNGDVWIVKGLKGEWKQVQWRRYATGLFETLGLKIVDDKVYVHGRDQITRLHDQNNDGEADWYECFNNDVLITKNFHEFAFSLQTDKEGNFYIVKGAPVLAGGRGFDKILPHNGTVMKISKYGKNLEVLATGLRAPGGLGVGPNGEITTGENEGTWQPCCKLNYFTGKDKFLGVEDAAHHLKGQEMHLPLCYFPMRIDNSGGGQVWVPENSNWGLHPGELIHLSYGQSSLYRVLKQEVDSTMQGGVVRIPVKLHSSAMRARFHPDGSLYTLGFRGWQTNAATPEAFQRIRYNGKTVTIPDQLKATEKGVYIRFEKELDAKSVADRFNFKVERWKYIRSRQYGSGEFSIDNPDLKAEEQALIQESAKYRKHDSVEVARSVLLADKKTLFLHIPSMKPAQQMSIRYKLKFADQTPADGEIINTVHKMAAHQDATVLADKKNTTAQLENLRHGLIQSITIKDQTDHRVSRLPAQYVSPGDAISDMLGNGAFTSQWSGFLKLDERMSPKFSLEGRGSAVLKIDGKEIIKVSGDAEAFSKTLSESIQLDPGTHRFELHYTSVNDTGQIRVLWQTESIPQQSIPATYFYHQPDQKLTDALKLRNGRDTLLQQNCTQCHVTDSKTSLPEHHEKGPAMKGIGNRVNQSWLAQWLSQTHTMKPGTTMPEFVDGRSPEGRQDAADMAAYLALFTTGDKAENVEVDLKKSKLGGAHFHSLGCVACHTLPDQTSKADNQRTPLNNISSKYNPGALVAYLTKPDRHYAASKMPDFKLSQNEAHELAAYLLQASKGKNTPPVEMPKGDAGRGKKLVVSHNCAACHDDLDRGTKKLPDFNTIVQSNWAKKGCLTLQKNKKGPDFNLSGEQIDQLENFLAHSKENASEKLAHTSTHDYVDRQFKSLNCMACHERDGEPSLLASLHSQSQSLTEGIKGGDHHKVDQSRPQLTYIGEMLHTDYLQQVLDGSVKERPRPWLAMRMPAFHSRAKLLADGLCKQHGMAPSKPDFTEIDQDKAAVGKKLIGSSGGFACTICHAVGETKALAAFEVEGINFDRVARRLRPGYYHRWMENPLSITPTTKMPRYTTDNVSPLADYDKDARKQFEAILEYFRSLEKQQ
ncbi:hypothetical protein NT6N_08880 [Oceaniferula spumae]|uniref:Cytochrome c n=1 Tax=Oceaniferula spumae TaxID=2979115 RepID=A0AAT9FIR1_9BACT